MAFAFTLDSTVPAEGALVSAGASNIRNLTAALIERLNSFFVDANTSPLTGKTGASMAATTFTGLTTVSYANPEFRTSGNAINQNLNHTFYDNGVTEKGHLIYAGANSVSNRYFGLFSDAADFLLIATLNNVPMQFWTNTILAMTIGTNQAVTLASSLTATSVLASVNQNATTLISVSNTDVTNAASRAELRVVGGAISGIMSSIATDALYIGASTNSIVRFISNGAEKFRLNTDGTVTFQNAISTNAGGANITGGVAIQTGGLSIVAGDANFAAGIKQTGTVVARFENTVITRPAGSAGSGVEIGSGIIQSYNVTGLQYTTLQILASLVEITQGPLLMNTAVGAGAAAGDIVLPNLFSIRGVNAAGSTTLALISLHSSNRTTLDANGLDLGINNALTSTTASTGAQTLPAGPQGFLSIRLNNGANVNKIPYYAS